MTIVRVVTRVTVTMIKRNGKMAADIDMVVSAAVLQ